MNLKVDLAKALMKACPAEPTPGTSRSLSELLNHESFLNAGENERERILFRMAEGHYLAEQRKPFDHYFPRHDLRARFSGKVVLDLGCWCGGKTVSYAERWGVKSMHGVDVDSRLLAAARLFSSSRGGESSYHFSVGAAESIPFEDESFDGVVSFDVFEHVKSLRDVLSECRRVLKPGGALFSVFFQYHQPFAGAHLDLVTRTPALQWFFDSETLNAAYSEILESRGGGACWYKPKQDRAEWRKLSVGIGINGVTFSEFQSIVEAVGFKSAHIPPTPLFSVGAVSLKHPAVRRASSALKPLLKSGFLREYLSHCIISTLVA